MGITSLASWAVWNPWVEWSEELQTICYVWIEIPTPDLLVSSAKLAAQILLFLMSWDKIPWHLKNLGSVFLPSLGNWFFLYLFSSFVRRIGSISEIKWLSYFCSLTLILKWAIFMLLNLMPDTQTAVKKGGECVWYFPAHAWPYLT